MTRYSTILSTIIIPMFVLSPLLAQERATPPPSRKSNVVLIVIDTLRADHMSCYGYERQTTPNLDKLAKEGFLFERCYSTSSWTLPACASLFTGLYPKSHGVNQWRSILSKHLPVLPELLAERGYYCAGVSSNPFLTAKQGFARGFDVFDDTTVLAAAEWSFPLLGSKYKAVVLASTGATTTRRAMELLNDRATDKAKADNKPFFLFVHYMDPHADYTPPAPFNRKFDPDYKGRITGHVQSRRFGTDIAKRDLEHVIGLYDGEIAYTDKQVGQLLDHLAALQLDRDTCVIVTADHGEEFLEHGNWGHGYTLFEEAVRVPLIIRWPERVPPGKRSKALVSLVDIMPTLLNLLKIKCPETSQGENLSDVMRGQPQDNKRAVMIETALGNPLRAIVCGTSKLICPTNVTLRPRTETALPPGALLFDMSKNKQEDRSQVISQAGPRKEIVTRYVNMLAELTRTASKLANNATDEKLRPDIEHIERLKSLGYVGE